MMKAYRSTLVLATLVLIVAGYAYIFEYKKSEEEKLKKDEQQKIFQTKEDDIVSITLKWAGAETVIEKHEGEWKLVKPIQDKVDETAMNTLLKSIADESSQALVSDDPATDLKIYGLDDPLGTIMLKTKNGVRTIDIGQVDGLGGSKYARIHEEHKIVTLDSSAQAKFAKTSRDIRDKRIVRIQNIPLVDIGIAWMDKERNFKLDLIKKEASWSYNGKPWAVDIHAIDSYASQIQGLRASEFMQEEKSDAQAKKKYKLDRTLAKFEIKTGDGKSETVFYHGIEDGKAYVTVASRPTIYQLQPNALEQLKIKPDHFRDRKQAFLFEKDKIDKMEIRTELTRLSLVKEGETWKEEKPEENMVVHTDIVGKLVEDLQNLSVSEFLGEAKKKEFSQALGSIVLRNKDGVEFEIKWGRELSQQNRLVITNKSNEALAVSKAVLAALPLQTIKTAPVQKDKK